MKIFLRNVDLVFQLGSFDVDAYIDTRETSDNAEFKTVIIDSEGRILWGRYVDNTTTSFDLTGYTTPSGVSITRIVNKIISKYHL